MTFSHSMRAVLLLSVFSAGCAQTANVRCWQPADVAAGELRSLAVVGAADDVDQRVAIALEQRIRRESGFEVVAHQNEASRIILAGYLEDDGPGLEGLLQYSREADVDAVVVVDVDEYEVRERPRDSGPWNSLLGEADRRQRAEVEVNFELIDTLTGEVLASRSLTRKATRRAEATESPATDELLDRLLSECVDEFVAVLAPRETESTIQLAEGEFFSWSGPSIRRGVRFARAGRWQQAQEVWSRAIARNAHDDAALFNLGVASAQAGDYASAEDFAMEALRVRHTECYANGLEQIRELRSASEEAEQQMRTAVVPAGYAGGPDWLSQ